MNAGPGVVAEVTKLTMAFLAGRSFQLASTVSLIASPSVDLADHSSSILASSTHDVPT
jgi:hypothetical protein